MHPRHTPAYALRETLLVWRRYWFASLATFLGILVLTAALVAWLPRRYYSSAMYMVRLGRESVALDATATVGETIELYRTSDSEIRSTLEILRSQTLAEMVVDRVGIEAILETGNGAGPAGSSITTRLRELVPRLDPISEREKAVITFREHFDVDSPQMSNVIAVTYQAPDPDLALRVMRTVTELFLAEHARLNRTEGSFAFFAEQETTLREQMERAAERLQTTKTEYGLSSIEGNRRILENRMDDVQAAMLANQQEQASLEARVASLTTALADLPAEIALQRTSGVANAARDGMRQQLYDLELQERELQEKLSDDHPKLLTIRAQREQAEKIYAEIQGERTETALGVNPTHQQLTLELLTAQAQLSSHQARGEILGEQQRGLVEEIAELNRREARIDQLAVDYAVAKERYEKHASLLEQARLQKALSDQEISSISVIEQPSHNERPSFPSKKMFVILGSAMAFLGAFAAPLSLNFLRLALIALPEHPHAAGRPHGAAAHHGAGPESEVYYERVAVDSSGRRRGEAPQPSATSGRDVSLVGSRESDL